MRKINIFSNLLLYTFIIAGNIFSLSAKSLDKDFKKAKYGTYVIAHRGAHNGIPENSLPAYQKAIDLGCDFIEIDIRTTKDGKFVSIHNPTIDSYLNGKSGKVNEMTFEELRKLDIGIKIDEKWKGTKIPSFEEILDLAKGKIGIYLDLKDAPILPLAGLIKKYGMEKSVVWYIPSNRKTEILELQRLCPECIPMPDPGSANNIEKVSKSFNPGILATDMSELNEIFVGLAHYNKMMVFVDENRGSFSEWNSIAGLKADGIQTDRPEELIAFLKKERGGTPDPGLSQSDNDYLDRQVKVFLDTIKNLIKNNPPVFFPENREREMAKFLADAVFHDQYAVYRKPVQNFFKDRVDKVINEIETTKVEMGIRIWKVYNMAFIARSPSVTIAFDLVSGITSGSTDFAMTPNQIHRLVKQCDVLFITHRHADHAEKAVAEQFLEQNLPVVAPDQVWKNDPISEKVIHLERTPDKIHKLKLKTSSIDLIIFPGHQMKNTDNNVYLVRTPEGISIAHIGDQINEGDFMDDYEWIDKVAHNQIVDILIPNSWTNEIMRIAKGFNPKLILPGHEIEMGHPVWDRVPYWGDDEFLNLNYNELKKSKYPVSVLMWGESFHYVQKSK